MTAGLGAGWSTEEFAAVGMTLPPFRPRMERLEEVLALARAKYTDGRATLCGRHVVACDLALTPVPRHPPRLLVGSGSDRAWPAGTPISWTCTATRGMAGWPGRRWRRRWPATSPAGR